ncbi:MAG: hypothetical protein ACRDIY_17395 [Chloroflexota bacterium]
MHAQTLASAVVLAPALALLLGFVIFNALGRFGTAEGRSRGVALVAAAIALGMAARLWVTSRTGAQTVILASPSGPAADTLAVHVDVLAAVCLVVLLLAGLARVDRDDGARSRFSGAALLLTLAVATCLFLSASIAALTVCWAGLIFLGAAESIARRELDDAAPLLALALCGAPVLVVSGAAIASLGNGSPLTLAAPPSVVQWAALSLALIGAASAGITPLNGWLTRDRPSEVASLVSDVVLPLTGTYLAMRALQLAGSERSIVLSVVLVGFGLWGAGDAAHAAFTARSIEAQSRAAGRGESGLAFVALAVGTQSSVAAALFLTAFSVLARTSVRVAGRDELARLGWASTVGLPPLPGLVGRWLVVAAALAAGEWPLAVALGAAALLLDLGVFANRAFPARPARSTRPVALALLGAIALGGLIPTWWLIARLLPGASLPGTTSPAPSAALGILALAIALTPVLIAPLATKPRSVLPHADLGRAIQERAWDAIERFAEGAAGIARIVEGRYNLAAAFVVIVVAIFAFVR